jgi:hypothetical protein
LSPLVIKRGAFISLEIKHKISGYHKESKYDIKGGFKACPFILFRVHVSAFPETGSAP